MATSASKRILSGSMAAWAQIGVNLTAQLIITPIYLSRWSTEQFGIWLTFLSVTSFVQIIDTGHQSYVGNRYLMCGKDDPREIERIMSSAVLVGIMFSLFQTFLIIAIVNSHLLDGNAFKNFSGSELFDFKLLISLHLMTWFLTGSYGTLLTRALSPFGHFSRFSWWQTTLQIAITISPVPVVLMGGSFLHAGIAMVCVTLLINCFILSDTLRLLKKNGIGFTKPKFSIGWQNFSRSLVVVYKSLCEMLRQQGMRLLLIPLVGTSEMAAFSVMRTGANVANQGLSSITNPILPELMRFLKEKDAEKSEASFGVVWVIVIAILSPSIILLQAIAEPIFQVWTHGKIVFDPKLFSLLSLGVLVYAASQPAIAVVNGNNLLRPQFFISTLSVLLLLSASFVLVKQLGNLGAGYALLITEIFSSLCYVYVGKNWLTNNKLRWPSIAFNLVLACICITSVSMVLLILIPGSKVLILLVTFLLLLGNCVLYWRYLPPTIGLQIRSKISRFKLAN